MYRVADEGLKSEKNLLEWREQAEVDRLKSTDGDRANTHEEAVDVRDMVTSICSIEDARENEWCGRAVDQGWR